MGRGWRLLAVGVLLVACGQTQSDRSAASGGAGSGVGSSGGAAGTAVLIGGSAGNATGNVGAVGGAVMSGAAGTNSAANGGQVTGTAGEVASIAGEAGAGGETNADPTAYDYALWPMPNDVTAGLPNPARYDTSVPGVATDNVTHLVWQLEPLPDELSLTLGGHDDWRVPSLKELHTIVDVERSWPALDVSLFPGSDSVVNGWYWSSSVYPDQHEASEQQAPGTRFADGNVQANPIEFPLLVRCMR